MPTGRLSRTGICRQTFGATADAVFRVTCGRSWLVTREANSAGARESRVEAQSRIHSRPRCGTRGSATRTYGSIRRTRAVGR